MEIRPVAYYHCDISGKFGLPRQAGLAPSLEGKIVFEPEFRSKDALRGLDGFDYVHLIWGFSLSNPDGVSLTVRPPRLGGNERVGVFASRSPFRPNSLGLSSVRVVNVDFERCEIVVAGADLADGTPIFDVKPYVEYADSHPGVRSGFVDEHGWVPLEVEFSKEAEDVLNEKQLEGLREILAQDPRPQYHNDASRVYGIAYCAHDVRFSVDSGVVRVIEITEDPHR